MGQALRRHHHLVMVVVKMGTSTEQAIEENREEAFRGGF